MATAGAPGVVELGPAEREPGSRSCPAGVETARYRRRRHTARSIPADMPGRTAWLQRPDRRQRPVTGPAPDRSPLPSDLTSKRERSRWTNGSAVPELPSRRALRRRSPRSPGPPRRRLLLSRARSRSRASAAIVRRHPRERARTLQEARAARFRGRSAWRRLDPRRGQSARGSTGLRRKTSMTYRAWSIAVVPGLMSRSRRGARRAVHRVAAGDVAVRQAGDARSMGGLAENAEIVHVNDDCWLSRR